MRQLLGRLAAPPAHAQEGIGVDARCVHRTRWRRRGWRRPLTARPARAESPPVRDVDRRGAGPPPAPPAAAATARAAAFAAARAADRRRGGPRHRSAAWVGGPRRAASACWKRARGARLRHLVARARSASRSRSSSCCLPFVAPLVMVVLTLNDVRCACRGIGTRRPASSASPWGVIDLDHVSPGLVELAIAGAGLARLGRQPERCLPVRRRRPAEPAAARRPDARSPADRSRAGTTADAAVGR